MPISSRKERRIERASFVSSVWRSKVEESAGAVRTVLLLFEFEGNRGGEGGGVGKSCSTPWSRREGRGSLIYMAC